MTIDTTKLRELAQKAVPGPWGYELDHGSYLRIYSDAGVEAFFAIDAGKKTP